MGSSKGRFAALGGQVRGSIAWCYDKAPALGRVGGRVGRYLLVAMLGFVGGGLALFFFQSRNAPPLEAWHQVQLVSEFRAEKASEVQTFDDYLELEERLFAELDEKVYQNTPTGPSYALARYSTGSSADPRGRKPDWNRSFELPGNELSQGVLLLHGMSDSPYSLRALAESLHERGYWVLGLRMPGHGTVPSGLKSIEWEDLAAVTRFGMEHLSTRVGSNPIHMVGYSTGALLALDYVLRGAEDRGGNSREAFAGREPASLILMSPAIGVGPIAGLAGWMTRLARVPGLERLAWESIRPEFDPHKYNSFASNAGFQVHRLVNSVASRLEALGKSGPLDLFPPTLVFLSAVDATVSVNAVIDTLMGNLPASRHELFLFDINRSSVRSTVLVSDPGPLTARLLNDPALPFHFSLISNESPESTFVALHRKKPLSGEITSEGLDLQWPTGLISLSHIALQFPPDDPLYGQRPARSESALHLGQMAIQGERGLLQFPSTWLLRVRHNPFYEVLEERVVSWADSFGKPVVELGSEGAEKPNPREDTLPN